LDTANANIFVVHVLYLMNFIFLELIVSCCYTWQRRIFKVFKVFS